MPIALFIVVYSVNDDTLALLDHVFLVVCASVGDIADPACRVWGSWSRVGVRCVGITMGTEITEVYRLASSDVGSHDDPGKDCKGGLGLISRDQVPSVVDSRERKVAILADDTADI